jgi:hypothetical protein
LAPRLDHRGQALPKARVISGFDCVSARAGRCYRFRRCLLKGCEQVFVPARPQSRYCSVACAQAARRWRRWRASRRYRASESGRERRRAQHGRYRQRQRERAAAAVAASESPAPAPEVVEKPAKAVGGEREGQRPAEFSEDFARCRCDRPGCYVQFAASMAGSNRRFCSMACRLALRRVLDREARCQWRSGSLPLSRPREPLAAIADRGQ